MGLNFSPGEAHIENAYATLRLPTLRGVNHQRLLLDDAQIDVDDCVQRRRDRGELAGRQVGASGLDV
jgi:hypothetical protein